MRGVADEGNPSFGTYPGGEWVSEDEFPVYETPFGSCADDVVAYGCPVGDRFYGFFDVAGCGPAFLDVGFVFVG